MAGTPRLRRGERLREPPVAGDRLSCLVLRCLVLRCLVLRR
ncbi:MAG: hypothetical protein ACRDRK_21225 [Pseudonocardia sp.]